MLQNQSRWKENFELKNQTIFIFDLVQIGVLLTCGPFLLLFYIFLSVASLLAYQIFQILFITSFIYIIRSHIQAIAVTSTLALQMFLFLHEINSVQIIFIS